MEQKKYNLKKQIIEAINSNDSDLYSLLKSQWAHRFGVESLEELENLDLNQLNQNTKELGNQKIDHSKENSLKHNKEIHISDDTQEKDIKREELVSVKGENKESFKIKSNKPSDKEDEKNEILYQFKENRNLDEIKVLIPLPPKPKYGVLNKWLLKK